MRGSVAFFCAVSRSREPGTGEFGLRNLLLFKRATVIPTARQTACAMM